MHGGQVAHLDENVPVTVLVKGIGVKYLELNNLATAMPIFANDVFIWIGPLRVLVQKLHVGVSRRGIQVIIQFLDVLSVISLGARHAEEPFFEHPILLVPQGQRKAETLVVVADACNAVFSPPIGP